MQLIILGATGGTGVALIDEALKRGHDVTAFVRSPKKVTRSDARLRVVSGNLLSCVELSAALRGADAVLSAFGPPTLKRTTNQEDFTRNLVASMTQTGVRRLLFVSVAFLFPGGLLRPLFRHTVFRNIADGAVEAERIVESSNLDWTIVRPPRLTDGPRTGRYRVGVERLPRGGVFISRADVADFMLGEVERPQHLRKLVGLSR